MYHPPLDGSYAAEESSGISLSLYELTTLLYTFYIILFYVVVSFSSHVYLGFSMDNFGLLWKSISP